MSNLSHYITRPTGGRDGNTRNPDYLYVPQNKGKEEYASGFILSETHPVFQIKYLAGRHDRE